MSYGELAEFLETSLDLLRDQVPRAHERLRLQLLGSPLLLHADRCSFVLTAGPTRFAIGDPHDSVALEIAVSKSVVLDLLDARTSLLEAVRADRLFLRGSVHSLSVFFAALQTYVRGALRSASFETLLAAYRQTRAARP